jgi:uncharacterized protein involved in type VI secretion and phage assembly
MKHLYGVHVGTVLDSRDPENQGRLKVMVPTVHLNDGLWARCAWMPGQAQVPPGESDEVLVAFAAGDPRSPIVIGQLWPKDKRPPVSVEDDGRVISVKSSRGAAVRIFDQDPSLLVIETPGGLKITLDDKAHQLRIDDGAGNSIVMDPAGVAITAAAKLKLTAASIEVSTGQLGVDAGMSNFSGVIKSDTVVTNSVVAASYTPGAGNIW